MATGERTLRVILFFFAPCGYDHYADLQPPLQPHQTKHDNAKVTASGAAAVWNEAPAKVLTTALRSSRRKQAMKATCQRRAQHRHRRCRAQARWQTTWGTAPRRKPPEAPQQNQWGHLNSNGYGRNGQCCAYLLRASALLDTLDVRRKTQLRAKTSKPAARIGFVSTTLDPLQAQLSLTNFRLRRELHSHGAKMLRRRQPPRCKCCEGLAVGEARHRHQPPTTLRRLEPGAPAEANPQPLRRVLTC